MFKTSKINLFLTNIQTLTVLFGLIALLAFIVSILVLPLSFVMMDCYGNCPILTQMVTAIIIPGIYGLSCFVYFIVLTRERIINKVSKRFIYFGLPLVSIPLLLLDYSFIIRSL